MKNKKFLFILIPVIIVALVLIAGIIFISLNGSPEKIFKNSISKVFSVFETTTQQYSSMRGSININASIESDNETLQELNTMLEGSRIGLNMEIDTSNVFINENLKVTYNNENLINAFVLLQDNKGYIYLPDWLDKYIEVSEDYISYSDVIEDYEQLETLDQEALIKELKEELIVAISNQKFIQEKTTVLLDGQETKVTASTLSLKGSQINAFYSELFNNLKNNENFQIALGAYKDEVLTTISELMQEMEDTEDIEFVFTIYTKGFLNEFVGISAKAINSYYEETIGINIVRYSEGKYEFVAYNEYEEEREEVLNVTIEDKKENENKGIATITITVDGEELVLLYNYEIQGDQNLFVLSTQIEGVVLSLSGKIIEDENSVKGNYTISVQEKSLGKINLNCDYDFAYGLQVQKVNTQNAVFLEEMSEEDINTFMTNLQNSNLYQIIEQAGILDREEDNQHSDDIYSDYDEPQVSYGKYTVKYSIPEGFEASDTYSEDYNMYVDEGYNSIYVGIEWETIDEYLKNLDDSYILTAEHYENQKISDIRAYTVNGKDYKFRTISYNDEYGKYVDLYFAYELDNEYCYVVEVESENGNISWDTIEKFLNITIK